MSWLPQLQSIAPAIFEVLIYTLIEGAMLAGVVALALRVVPGKSSRTVFAIWFSALVASAIVPLLALDFGRHTNAAASQQALITLPISVATYVLI